MHIRVCASDVHTAEEDASQGAPSHRDGPRVREYHMVGGEIRNLQLSDPRDSPHPRQVMAQYRARHAKRQLPR